MSDGRFDNSEHVPQTVSITVSITDHAMYSTIHKSREAMSHKDAKELLTSFNDKRNMKSLPFNNSPIHKNQPEAINVDIKTIETIVELIKQDMPVATICNELDISRDMVLFIYRKWKQGKII